MRRLLGVLIGVFFGSFTSAHAIHKCPETISILSESGSSPEVHASAHKLSRRAKLDPVAVWRRIANQVTEGVIPSPERELFIEAHQVALFAHSNPAEEILNLRIPGFDQVVLNFLEEFEKGLVGLSSLFGDEPDFVKRRDAKIQTFRAHSNFIRAKLEQGTITYRDLLSIAILYQHLGLTFASERDAYLWRDNFDLNKSIEDALNQMKQRMPAILPFPTHQPLDYDDFFAFGLGLHPIGILGYRQSADVDGRTYLWSGFTTHDFVHSEFSLREEDVIVSIQAHLRDTIRLQYFVLQEVPKILTSLGPTKARLASILLFHHLHEWGIPFPTQKSLEALQELQANIAQLQSKGHSTQFLANEILKKAWQKQVKSRDEELLNDLSNSKHYAVDFDGARILTLQDLGEVVNYLIEALQRTLKVKLEDPQAKRLEYGMIRP